jgi:type I restriction enzyme M protein
MVRLSLVNLYLHGFTNPYVDEYDTLTSEDKWNEHADVILANPPFMSPKGGIKPHKRFSIKATRSEVLFVDYIHEHLSPNGRAGIIVPEGVVFQNGGAYKSLRKALVQNSLVAVVSLPAGVFQPYSNVKTSILILDKRLAKQTDRVLFVKVSNDGFALGAQRRSFEQNDLPQAELALKAFYADPDAVETDEIAQTVSRLEIAKSEDWNLNGDRYRSVNQRESHFPLVPIGSVCQLFNGRSFKSEEWETQDSGGLPIVRIQNLNNPNASFNYFSGEVSERNTIESEELLFSWSGSRGTSFGAHIWRGEKAALNQHIFKVVFDKKQALKEYLLHALNKAVETVEQNLHGGVGLVHITKSNLEKILIPLPPIEIQREIVMKIKGYERRIEELKKEIFIQQHDIEAVIEELWH